MICVRGYSSYRFASISSSKTAKNLHQKHAPSLCTYKNCTTSDIDDATNTVVLYQTSSTNCNKVTRRFIHHHTNTPVSKVCPNAKTALTLSGLKSGDTIAVGGFGNGGIPETLLHELSSQEDGPTNLTVASLTAGKLQTYHMYKERFNLNTSYATYYYMISISSRRGWFWIRTTV